MRLNHELFEKIFCIPATSAPVESVFTQVDYPSCHTVHAWREQQATSELVTLKSNIKPQPV